MSEPVTDLTQGVYKRLYSGFIRGQRINKLSLQAEAWFWRVFAVSDDFGNAEADPEACRDATKGKRRVSPTQVGKWLKEMYEVGLVSFYWVKNEQYLHINRYEEMQPANRNGKRVRRFPDHRIAALESLDANAESKSIQTPHYDHDHNNDHDQHNMSRALQARTLFSLWQSEHNHPDAILETGGKRERAILGRLKAGFTVERLHRAIIGCKLSPYHMGKNDRSTPTKKVIYDDIELICRDAKHVEQFEGFYRQAYGDHYPPVRNEKPVTSLEDPLSLCDSRTLSLVSEQCDLGADRDTVLNLVVEQFGEAQREPAARVIELYNQAKAEMR